MPDMDDAYANGAYIEGAADYPPRWAEEAEAFRKALGPRARLGLSYGPSERMALDHFLPEGEAKGTLIFVHGGYWLKFDRSYWSHLAAGALAQGWCVAMPSYDLCPSVRIAGITQQVAQAVMAVADGSMGPISLAGHSAGGHLVSRMLAPGMLPASVTARLNHVMPISPVSDLEPLLQTTMNADFSLDAAMARAESPVHQPKPDVPVTVWVGADERPVFLDQARWLAKAWSADHVITQGEHHFNVIDALADPGSDMIRRLTTTP
ncbi:alpha/beta hydrolase [Tateyamaria omphalii]|uniref:Alpha/beta hydrolase n=1 Tax=Tateyamaria omphalii TaxID=299262 RepID=A0A1P8MXP1_9RHOB|nr:alpha/beta hydrolase [Tateyamaria omphalii]APX12857.1 alpha/beta hydrolase [Tateyamaria omphalii]